MHGTSIYQLFQACDAYISIIFCRLSPPSGTNASPGTLSPDTTLGGTAGDLHLCQDLSRSYHSNGYKMYLSGYWTSKPISLGLKQLSRELNITLPPM